MKFYFALSLLCIAATSSASPSRSSLQQPCSKCLQQEGCPYICQHVCEDLSSTACVSCIGSYCPASMTTCRHFCPPTRSHSEEEAEDPRPVGSSLVEDLAALLDPRPSPKDACSDCLSKSGDQGCIACEGVCRSDPNVECKRCVFDLCEKCFHACNPPDSDRSGSDRDSSGKRRQGLPMGERPRDEAGHHEPLSSSQQLDTCLKCVMLHGCSECRMPCLYPYSRECSSCVSIQCPVCSDNCRPPQLGVSRGREVGAPQQPLGPPMVERLDIRDHPSYAESGPPGSPGDLREVPMEDTLRHAGCYQCIRGAGMRCWLTCTEPCVNRPRPSECAQCLELDPVCRDCREKCVLSRRERGPPGRPYVCGPPGGPYVERPFLGEYED